MHTPWWRRSLRLLEQLLAEMIWLCPANASIFGLSAAEDAGEGSQEDDVWEPRAA